MDRAAKTRKVNALMTKFIQLYEDKYGQKPRFNRNTEKWGFGYMVDDLGVDSFPTLEYYFTLRRNQTSADFLHNYHDINDWMREDAEDEIKREALLEQTKKRVKEYEDRWQQKS